jgi:hypothetical protein
MKRKDRMLSVMIGLGLLVSLVPSITTADEFYKGNHSLHRRLRAGRRL